MKENLQAGIYDEADFKTSFQFCMEDEWYYAKLTKWQMSSLRDDAQAFCKAYGIEQGSYREMRECFLKRGGAPFHK